MEEKQEFNYADFKKEALKGLESGKDLSGKDGVLAPLLRDFIESALEAEMSSHLSVKEPGNRRNGKGKKRVHTSYGPVDISTPRDRNSDFDPSLLPKRQTVIGEAFENRILSLYAKGFSYLQVQEHLLDLYGVDISVGKLSAITDKVIPLLKRWQSRRLDVFYPIVWLDAMHFKVRENNQIVSKAVYIVIGLNADGKKELLGMYISQSEGARFWLSVLTDIQSRGVKDLLICCVDNLKGFTEAIEAIYPKADIQICIIHQIRNSRRFLSHKDRSSFNQDLKKIYQAANLSEAELALDSFEKKWNTKYSLAIKSWKTNWHYLTRYFEYSASIRKIMYTTNIIEGFNRQIRKITKTKGAFTSEMALFKLLYLAQEDITKKWINPQNTWKQTKQEFIIKFGERFIDKSNNISY
jgi:transposase-like protein